MYKLSPFGPVTGILFDYLPGYESIGQSSEEHLGIDCLTLATIAMFADSIGWFCLQWIYRAYVDNELPEVSLLQYLAHIFVPIWFWAFSRVVRYMLKEGRQNIFRHSVFLDTMRLFALYSCLTWFLYWITKIYTFEGSIIMFIALNEFLWMSSWFLIGCTPLPPGSKKGKLWRRLARLAHSVEPAPT